MSARRTVWLRVVIVAASLATHSACIKGAVMPYRRTDDTNRNWGLARDETGHEYCSRLALTTDANSQKHMWLGVVTFALVGAAAFVGAAMGPKEDDDTTDGDTPSWAQKSRNALVAGSGGLLAVPATLFLSRSASNSVTSSAARRASALEKDREAMRTCLEASASLLSQRGDDATEILKQQRREQHKPNGGSPGTQKAPDAKTSTAEPDAKTPE